MSDRTLDLLVGFEERFERQNHRVEIVTLQTEEIGESMIRCQNCREMATIATTNSHGAWYLHETKLDLLCSMMWTKTIRVLLTESVGVFDTIEEAME